MAYTISQNLNIRPKYFPHVVVHVSAGDANIPVHFSIYDGASTYTIPSGTTITVHGYRKDGGNWITNGTYSGNVVSFTLPRAAMAIEGAGIADVVFTTGNEVVGSANFCLLVERATFPNGVTYSNDTSVFQDLLNFVNSNAIPEAISDWLKDNITATSPAVDSSLSVQGAAADAKATGDALTNRVVTQASITGNVVSFKNANDSEKFTLDLSTQMFTFTDEDEANYSESVTIKKSNNQLYAKITPSGDLDDEAISGYSYRDLFVTNNVISGGGNFENGVPSGFTIYAGTPSITNEQHYVGSYSLKASGTSSQQFVCDLPSANANYYVALMANVTDYTKGYFGVQFSATDGSDPAATYCAFSKTTNGWEFASNIITPNATARFWIGSLTQASGTGYIDAAVIVPLPAGVTKSQLDTAYSSYLSIILSGKEFKIANRGYLSTSTAEQRRAAFVAAMNKKAEDLGMTNSVFYRADGATNDNKITARDMVKMVIEASAYKDIARVWGKNSYTITTQAGKAINLETTVHESVLEDYYPLIGGKTGTWGSSHTLVAICKVNDYYIAAGIGGAGSDQARFTAMKQLMDICNTILEGGTNAATVQAASYACAAVMPTINAFNYEGYEFSYLYEQAADTQFIPASTTKVLSAITALDHILDIYNLMEIESGDIVAGSGNVFASGDKITFLDCLYAMFLPSSNTAAYALSREIGKRLIYD